tara:strand:+ start:30 stop:599 length:570 start_codon:yes stop_codon:yes gene_type:complete
MEKKEAKQQFNFWTNMLDLEHTFTFDEAWDFMLYRRGDTSIHKPESFITATYSLEEFREGIEKVEDKMRQSDRAFKERREIDEINPLRHFFSDDGFYIREVFNPSGEFIVTKIHKYSSPFFLLKGCMTIVSEDGEKRIRAPHYGITKAGTKRIIYAHEDCVFVTVHRTDKTTIEEAEQEIIAQNFEDKK